MKSLGKKLNTVTQALAAGSESRSSQTAMAETVSDAITNQRTTFIEAGTGTGKSFAYLVPAVESKKTTVIATATIGLQNQLIEKDIPHVIAALGSETTAAILKGRNNYLCNQKLAELKDDPTQQLDLITDEHDVATENILEWADRTSVGDREEVDFEIPPAVWRTVSIEASECPGAARCPMGAECWSEQARTEAFSADIVVTNHHMYGTYLARDFELLDSHEVAIFDEAHQLPEILGATCGFDLSPNDINKLAALVRGLIVDESLINAIEATTNALTDSLEPHCGKSIRSLTTEIAAAVIAVRDISERAVKALRKARKTDNTDYVAKADRAILASDDLATRCDQFLLEPPNHVLWVEQRPGRTAIKLTPISVADIVAEKVSNGRAVVFTSATLPDGATKALGASEAEVIRVGSPFDYQSQGLLYCAADLPNPNAADFREAAATRMADLIEASRGRALLLFTSYSAMEATYDYLRPRCKFPLLIQGDLPKSKLLDEFKGNEEACLLATMSFWQGVDIPGSSLTTVIIDRIPFPRPDEPVTKAKREHAGPRAFADVDLPRAQTLLAQAAGRLIRSSTDRGVVAVCDPRLATNRNYRWELINALPDMRRTSDFSVVQNFLTALD